jgi:hypothetical protein
MGSRQSPEYKELLRAHGCAYCGEGVSGITLDHVQAKSAGGHDSRANIVPACLKCNSMKGSLGVVEFYARCKKVAPKRAIAIGPMSKGASRTRLKSYHMSTGSSPTSRRGSWGRTMGPS